MKATALIIDDEPDIRELVAMSLSRIDVDCHTAANLAEARNLLSAYSFDVCLTDMRLPDGNGVDFVRYLQEHHPALPVAVLTAHGNMQAAVEAMKNGAYDFVSKPVDLGLLRRLVLQAVGHGSTPGTDRTIGSGNLGAFGELCRTSENHLGTPEKSSVPRPGSGSASSSVPTHRASICDPANRTPAPGRTDHGQDFPAIRSLPSSLTGDEHLIGQSVPMRKLRSLIAKVAKTNAPVWITGESGTGKELIARLIHKNGTRAKSPFVAINCGAIPSELVESELFGHRKGSFTGATVDREGLFRQADGGTLFLDEVVDLPLQIQVKLLRAIQERSIRPVGANEEITVNVRLLSASHGDLAAAVEAGSFRNDLYFRLNVIALQAPPLRERPEDVPELALHVLSKLNVNLPDERTISLSPQAVRALQQYTFPGNVRELENLLERAVALADCSILDAAALQIDNSRQAQSQSPSHNAGNHRPVSDVSERERLLASLEEHRWNRKRAANSLGITYRQLRYRIAMMGLDDDTAA